MSIKNTSFEDQHKARLEAAIADEAQAVEVIKAMAQRNAWALRSLWGRGDGFGGGVMDIMANELGLPLYASNRESQGGFKKAVIGNALRTKVFERDAYRCVQCATHIDLSVDHIKAESKGGTLDMDNLQTLCRPCNSKKGVK